MRPCPDHEVPDRPGSAGAAFVSAGILLLAVLVSVMLAAAGHRAPSPETVENPSTASQWLVRAEHLARAGDDRNAELACRAALAHHPWHPGAAQKLTRLLLRRGDVEALRDWMDDLVLGDARLTERLFQLPGFEAYRDDPVLQALEREAQIQARD